MPFSFNNDQFGQLWSDPSAHQPTNEYNELYSQLELNQENINQINNEITSQFLMMPNGLARGNGSANNFQQMEISDSSSPRVLDDFHMSVHSSPSTVEDIKPQTTKKNGKSKKPQDEHDAILIATDDSQLTEEQLSLKRKAQNRQAQRAFRERKETKLKELQSKLNQLEQERQQLLDQLTCIREQNRTITTENEILKQNNARNIDSDSASFSMTSEHSRQLDYPPNATKEFNFPVREEAFIEGLIKGTAHSIEHHDIRKVYQSPDSGTKLLGIGAVWDYLILKCEEYDIEPETIDVNLIMSKLRGHELCHGFGPAYPIDLVDHTFLEVMHHTIH
jgi:hypothetical protein